MSYREKELRRGPITVTDLGWFIHCLESYLADEKSKSMPETNAFCARYLNRTDWWIKEDGLLYVVVESIDDRTSLYLMLGYEMAKAFGNLQKHLTLANHLSGFTDEEIAAMDLMDTCLQSAVRC